MTDPKSDRPTLTAADLDRLDALLREAAPGPLVVKALPRMYSSGIDTWLVVNTATNDVCASQFDYGNPGGPLAHLIAAAINALPALLRLARLGLVVEETGEYPPPPKCSRCQQSRLTLYNSRRIVTPRQLVCWDCAQIERREAEQQREEGSSGE